MRMFAFVLSAALLGAQTSPYPGALPTYADLLRTRHHSSSTLTSGIDAATLSVPVADGTKFIGYELITIGDEQMLVCSVAGNTLTICAGTRGWDYTDAATHDNGVAVDGLITAWHHNMGAEVMIAITTALGVNLSNVAPADATHITQTPNAALTAEQALSALTTGVLKSTTGTGVVSIATGTDLPSHVHAGADITSGILSQVPVWDKGGAVYNSKGYDFPAQAPGGTLTASVPATVTLAPVPLGVNHDNTNHYLYVSGGTGTAEAVLITGGTAHSGEASGTITFTPANNHSGAWTIASATAGIQEALWAAGAYGPVRVPAGSHTLYAKLRLPYTASLRGMGIGATTLVMTTGFVTRAIECIAPTPERVLDIGDFRIDYTTNGTSQEGLYLQEITDLLVSNLEILDSYDGITGYGVGRSYFNSVVLFPRRNAYNFSSDPGSGIITVSTPMVLGGNATMQSGVGAVFSLGPTIAGMVIAHFHSTLGAYGILATASSGAINEVVVSNSFIDSYATRGIHLALSGTASASSWSITNTLFAGASGNTAAVLFQTTTPGNIKGLTFAGNKLSCNHTTSYGMSLQGVYGASITGNIIYTLQAALGVAVLLEGYANSNMVLGGNTVGVGAAGTDTNGWETGLLVGAQAHSEIIVANNHLYGSATGLNYAGTGTGVVFRGNRVPLGAKPTASAGIRGSTWYTEGGAGVADAYEVCRKDASNNYAWTAQTGGTGGEWVGDFLVTRSSPTTLTIGTQCTAQNPCHVRFGNWAYAFASASTVSLVSGTGTAYIYAAPAGQIVVGHAMNLTCSDGCVEQPGITSFPADSIPLFAWAAINGAWAEAGGTDWRAWLSTKNVLPGLGMTASESAGATTLAVNPATVHSYLTGAEAPPATCTVGYRYLRTDTSQAYDCPTTNTWVEVTGGGGGLSDPGSNSMVYRSALNTTIPATATHMSGPNFCVDAGATDDYAGDLSPAISGYITGTLYRFKANTANTGACTVNFNAVGAIPIKKVRAGITSALADNDILAGQWVEVIYDGTNMQMISAARAVMSEERYLPAAAYDGNAASTRAVWNTAASPYVPIPTVTGTNPYRLGVLQFGAADEDYGIFDVLLPATWDAGPVAVKVFWFTSSTETADAVIRIETVCIAAGEDITAPTFNAAQSQTAATTTANLLQTTTWSATTTGCAAGEPMRVRFGRNGPHESDTYSGNLNVVAAAVTYSRYIQ